MAALARVDYEDAFSVRLAPPVASLDARDLATALVTSVPWPVRALMAVRNVLVPLLGVDPGRPERALPTFRPGSRVAFFDVFAAADDEVVLGEDDRHLDYRLVLTVDRTNHRATARTLVTLHGWRGRLYFLPVRPYHRLIVPRLLRRAVRSAVAANEEARPASPPDGP